MKTKTFDCVAMKHEIQEKLRQQHGQRSWSERNTSLRQRLRADPHLSRLLEFLTDAACRGDDHN